MKQQHVWVLALFFFVGCSNKDGLPKGVLPPAKMQDVLWGYFQAEAYTEQFLKKDSAQKLNLQNSILQEQLFSLHKITKEQFYTSYRYYSSNAELMRPLLDSISVRAEAKRTAVMSRKYGNHPMTE